jgi:hypothetical protein
VKLEQKTSASWARVASKAVAATIIITVPMNFSSDRRVGGAEKLMMVADDWLNEVLDQNFSGIHPNDSTSTAEDGGVADEDDDPFWSKEQLILIENFPANAFVFMGLIVSIIGIFGLVANGMVLFIFSR